jgi:hypothetical protein
MAKKNEKGGGARKYDRNRAWCKAYRLRGQREINQAIRLRRHLHRFPNDREALHCLSNLPAIP